MKFCAIPIYHQWIGFLNMQMSASCYKRDWYFLQEYLSHWAGNTVAHSMTIKKFSLYILFTIKHSYIMYASKVKCKNLFFNVASCKSQNLLSSIFLPWCINVCMFVFVGVCVVCDVCIKCILYHSKVLSLANKIE